MFPASIASAVTVTIPTGVNAAFGVLRILTNSTITIQRAVPARSSSTRPAKRDNGDINDPRARAIM